MNKHAIDADVTRGRGKKEWTGIWSVVYLTHAQIHIVAAARKVSAYQSNKTICFTLLSTIATLMYIYTYIYIEKVRDASFVMVKTDNSINHIFTCNTKKNFSKSFSFYLFSSICSCLARR
jgi:hypothetical protein